MGSIRIGAVAAVVALAIGAAGCGGDDGGDSTSADAAPTKEEFIAQGNQICADANQELQTAADEAFGGQAPSQADLEQFVSDSAIPSIEDQLSQLEALGAPEGDEDQINAILDAVRQGLTEVQDDPGAISTGTFDEANQLAVDYGLDECAN